MSAEEIRFLALNGSERVRGSTARALELAGERLSARGCSLETVNLREHRVTTCDCGRCNSRSDPCGVDDDVWALVARMAAADCLLYAVPVHGFGLASVMQRFIERAGVGRLRFDRPLTNKIGGAVVLGRRYSHSAVHAQLVENMLLNRMIVVGSGFPALIHSGGPQAVEADTEGCDAMYRLLDRMVETARFIREAEHAAGRTLAPPAQTELRVGPLS